MKAYTQSIYRSIKSNLSKLLSIFFIILLGIAFVSGIGTLSSMITNSFGEYYEEHNIPDLIIKDTSGEGFSLSEDEEVLDIEKDLSTYENYIKSTYVTVFDTSAVPALEETIIAQIEESMPGISSSISVDLLPDDFPLTRFSTIQQDQTIDTLTIVEGRFPESDDEIAVEQMQDSMIQYNVGDVINLGAAFGGYKKIVGIIKNPLVISKYGEPDLVNQDLLEQIIYFYGDTISAEQLPEFRNYYVALVGAAAERLRQIDPATPIEIETALFDFGWTEAVLAAGLANKIDLLGVHVYKELRGRNTFPEAAGAVSRDGKRSYTEPYRDYGEQIAAFRKMIRKYNPNLKINVSETGVNTGINPIGRAYYVSAVSQAKFLARL